MIHGFINDRANCWLNTLIQVLLSCKKIMNWALKIHSCAGDKLVSLLSNELILLREKNSYSPGFIEYMMFIDKDSRTKSVEEAFDHFVNGAKIEQLFRMRYKCEFVCKCGYKSETYDNMNILRIPLGETFDYLLNHKTSIDFICSCGNNIVERNDSLVELNDICVLCCNKTNLNFPNELKLKRDGTPIIYRLVASVEHVNGHYYACCRREEVWYLMNDENIIKLREFVNTANTYLLIYENCEV